MNILASKPLPVADLSTGVRRRGLHTVMIVTFLMNAGFFLIIPLVSVHYVDDLGWAAAFVGLVLAVRQFTQQGLTVFGGALADRFGSKPLILSGVLIRALSFVMLGFAAQPWLLLAAGFLAAVGGALFDAPQRATMATLAPEDELTNSYGRLGILQNVARAVGPLIGALLIRYDFEMVGLASAAFFLLAFLVTFVFLPPVEVCAEPQSARKGLELAFADLNFVGFTALMMGFWFMWVQLSIAMPLKIESLTGSDSSVGVLFAVSAVLSILLQMPALRLAQRHLQPTTTIVIGMVNMAFGLAFMAFSASILTFYVAVFFFALGSVLAAPNSQTVTAEMADDRARGAYFGVSSLALAVGGGLGHILGGTLVDAAARLQMPLLPWATFATVGLVSAAGLAVFHYLRWDRPRSVLSPVSSGD